jgi:hypothetical protein
MRSSILGRRWPGAVGFLLAACCFALPFSGWSGEPCTTATVTYRGTDLLRGAAVPVTVVDCGGEGMVGGARPRQVVPEVFPALTDLRPYAVAALVAVLVGVAVAVLPWRRLRSAAGIGIAVAAVSGFVAVVVASAEAQTPYLGVTKAVSHDVPTGPLVAVVILLQVAAWYLTVLIRTRRSRG